MRGRTAAVPLIQISQTPGLSDRVKNETIAAVTEAYARATGKNPDSVWVTITEIPRTQWGVGGVPLG
ncbi:MAG: tautomerase family protein [Gordonia sp. (in: high G+C Gram-positive bacteria)]